MATHGNDTGSPADPGAFRSRKRDIMPQPQPYSAASTSGNAEQWDAIAAPWALKTLFENRPLLGYETAIAYDDLLTSALELPGINSWEDVLAVKSMVDCLWRWQRFQQLETIAATAEKQVEGIRAFASELGLASSQEELLANVLRAADVFGATDEVVDFTGAACVTPRMLSLGSDGSYGPLRAAFSRELARAKSDHAAVLSRMGARNPSLLSAARTFSEEYVAWRISCRVSRGDWEARARGSAGTTLESGGTGGVSS